MEYLGSTSMDRYDPAKTNTIPRTLIATKKVPTGPTIKSGYVVLPKRDVRPLTQYELPETVPDPYSDPRNPYKLTINDISSAAVLLKGSIEKTPCTRALATASYGMEVYFKKELMLFTGSYKERSALNTLLSLTDSQKKAGIVTASTGNFAMAVSFYGRKLDVAVTVVLPKGTPIQKVQKCRNFNARTVVEGKDMTEVKAAALKMAKEKGFLYLNGCDHPGVMAGGGTIGIEILEDVPEPDAVIVPVGNGGLIAGIAVAIKTLSPRTQIIGVESDKCPCFSAALDNNQPIHTHPKKSLADALSLPMAGYNSFFTVQPLIDKMVVVREEWLTLAMLRLTEEEKCIVEGSGAAGLAAILTGLLIELKGKKVVVVLSGGNIYTPMFSHCLDRGLAADGRLIKFCILIKDKPGGLSALCELLTVLDVTIRSIAHRRQEERDIFGVKVQVLCETRNWNHSLALENDLKKNYGEVEFAEIPLILQEQFVPEPPQKKINKPCAKYVQPQQNILL